MSPSTQIILSGMLTFGVPLLIALGELLGLRRAAGGGARSADPGMPDPVSPPGGLEPPHGPLPACLLPPYPVPASAPRPRVLEPT